MYQISKIKKKISKVKFYKRQEEKPDKVPGPSGIGTVEDYWKPSLKLLSNSKFLDSLLKFDKDNIPETSIKKLQDRVLNNEAFDPERVKVASSACAGLCKWVLALVEYDKVARFIRPKRIALKEAENTRDVKFYL